MSCDRLLIVSCCTDQLNLRLMNSCVSLNLVLKVNQAIMPYFESPGTSSAIVELAKSASYRSE